MGQIAPESIYDPGRDVFIIVYSIDDRNSFQEAIRLREQIQSTKNTANSTKCTPMVIAGNKCDKDNNRQVPLDEAKAAFDQTRRCVFLETSAKKFYNVDVLFRCLFENARLPSEMSPSLHRKVSASHGPTSLRPSHNGKLALRRRLSEACGMVTPNARRPSVRSDLLQLRLKTIRGSSMDEVDDDESERGSIHRKLRKAMCCIQ
ncbi:dexamethasone-induced Ras-related protein 1-like [Lytechinus pictus]|uniref:dexamethasone-induced Ras-related protein 1-like n=1 Tax=Lytechinus pictus TaxID=7653 RepID=UPI0030B9D760